MLRDAEIRLAAAANLTSFDADQILGVVNENRMLLGVRALASLADVTQNLAASYAPGSADVNPALFEGDVGRFGRGLGGGDLACQRAASATELAGLIDEVRKSPSIRKAVDRARLVELGLECVDDTGACPLCDKPWPAGELREYLETKAKTARAAASILSKADGIAKSLDQCIVSLLSTVDKITVTCGKLGATDLAAKLKEWNALVEGLRAALSGPVADGSYEVISKTDWRRLGLEPLTISGVQALAAELKSSAGRSGPQAYCQGNPYPHRRASENTDRNAG